MNGQWFYFAKRLPWGGLCTMYGRKFSLVLFIQWECVRGHVVWVCSYFTQSKAFYALNLGPPWGHPQTPWALPQTKITQTNFLGEFGGLLIFMNVPPWKVCLLVQSARDLAWKRSYATNRCNGLFSCRQSCGGCSFEKHNPHSCEHVFQNTPSFFFETSGDTWQVG